MLFGDTIVRWNKFLDTWKIVAKFFSNETKNEKEICHRITVTIKIARTKNLYVKIRSVSGEYRERASCSFKNFPQNFFRNKWISPREQRLVNFSGKHLIPVQKKKREIGFSPSRGGSFERVTDGDVRKCDVLRLCDARDTSLSRNLTLRMTDAYKYRMIMIFVKNCRPPFSLPMVNASWHVKIPLSLSFSLRFLLRFSFFLFS